MKEYFKVLGLEEGASIHAVKKAYRKLALQYHPDLQSGNEERFKKIVEAYEMIKSHLESTSERRSMNPEDLERFYDLLKKAAEEKARKKAFERAARIRKKKQEEQERSMRLGFYSLIGVVLFSILAYYSYFWHRDWQISRNPKQAVATVVGIESHRMVYTFEHGKEKYQERVYARGYGITMLAQNGMPLRSGDQFIVHFREDEPKYNRVNTYQVSSKTLNRYFNLATNAIQRYYSFYAENPRKISQQKARCLGLMIYREYGLEGLVKCYHFETNPLDYLSYNSITWSSFWEDESLDDIREACGLDSM